MFEKKHEFLEGEKKINYTMRLSDSMVSDLLDNLTDFILNMIPDNFNPYDYKMYSELLVLYYYTDLIEEKVIVEGFQGTHTTYLVKGYTQFFNEDIIPEQVKTVMEIGQKMMDKVYYDLLKEKGMAGVVQSDAQLIEFLTAEENKHVVEGLKNLSNEIKMK